jgi:glycosyltransferase involved in cell wall biosynthesis
MKLFIINTLYYPNLIGGAEQSVQLLAEAMFQQGHEVVVVSTSPNSDRTIEFINGVKVYYLGLKNLYWQFGNKENLSILKPIWHTFDTYNPWMSQELEYILDMEQPDIVHTNNLGGFSVLVWQTIKKRNIALIHTLRDYYLLCIRSAMFRKGKNCEYPCLACQPYILMRRYFSQLPDAVVGISHYILQKHLNLNYFHNTSIRRTIFNICCPTSRLIPSLPYRRGMLRLGYLGKLQPDKGIEFLLNTLKNLSISNWELLVAGKGTVEYESYLKKSYQSPNISYLGFIKNENFFPKIDFLIVPSLWNEPLGRVVFEAYSYGIPVIASNRGGIPEIIDEGETGFLFESSCSKTLLDILSFILQNPEIKLCMQEKCLKKLNCFQKEHICQQYLNVYHTILDSKCAANN